jgi:hypothetical protein
LNFLKPTTATASANRAILIANSPCAAIRTCWFDQYYAGVALVTSYGCEVIWNNFSIIKSVAIFSPDPSFNGGLIENNIFNACGLTTGDAAVNIHDSDGGLTISNNIFEGNLGCVLLAGDVLTACVTSNYFEGSTNFDFYVSGTFKAGRISSNRFGSGLSVTLANISSSYFVSNLIAGGTTQFDPATCIGNYVEHNAVLGGATLSLTGSTVTRLPPAASNLGLRFIVSDATVAASGNFGATVVGGGANRVPVYSDGVAWRIG